jgi:putative hemolysin
MDILLIFFLTLLNAVFAMSEMALASSRKTLLSELESSGAYGAKAALALQNKPTEFLSTIQIGITTLGVINGIVGEAAFSNSLAAWFSTWPVLAPAAGILATTLVVTLITVNTILLGELVPKRIGQLFPETVARWTAPLMLALAMMASPLVHFLSKTTSVILHLLRIDAHQQRTVTEEEIRASLVEGVDAGLIEHHEHQMVKNVFHLDERALPSIMLPRTDIVWLDSQLSTQQAVESLSILQAHSWYPVCREGLDDVLGVVSMASLLQNRLSLEPISQWMEPAVFVPETLSGLDMLSQFRHPHQGKETANPSGGGRMVLVVDEYGVVQGLMTPRDLLEAITGELVQTNADDAAWAVQREDGSWLLDGMMPVQELKSRLNIKSLPQEDEAIYNTLAGLILAVSGRLPQVSEASYAAGWRFEVVDLDGRRIDKVWASYQAQGLDVGPNT